MTQQQPLDDLSLVLSKDPTGGRIRVSLESFLLFNADVDHQLASLVARWSDFVTPHSEQLSHLLVRRRT